MAKKDLLPGWRGDIEWRGRAAALSERFPAQAGYDALERLILARPAHTYHLHEDIAASLDHMPDDERRRYIYGFMLWQMDLFEARFARSGLPDDFILEYGDSFHRIMDGIEQGRLCFDLRLDLLHKDVALTRLELVPAVAHVLFLRSAVPLRTILKMGWKGFRYVYWRCRGRRPFAELHLHDTMAGDYLNYDGAEECYRLVAILLRSMPQLRGTSGYTWMMDPQLRTISPRLAYLHQRPLEQGAIILPIGRDEDATRLALMKSPTRRAAYEAGTFRPRRVALIWSSRDLIKHYL